ncbi:SDR family NAD(P)-dependent oxidoreductase [Zhihengliuella flava]|uniref:NAD(P)-dependent dehydrogenase (Short-subunit alcohol dehydrogenase family) n=1 Tax=Zhihengliuella flava TaxID=1285193 RepID=A0A931D4I9_9MICC|nr:SDR family NAD(P)-dependent oxidoreductase [Zhihengliuella flava]MBG6084284.1 NAD(P)-dependent dehydrogenase (short-subunit alcohol dehydrogenase family) [Zhihengliuella flava]
MTQRTILITGASDGIGAAAARSLAARGERLLLVGRTTEKLHAVAGPLGAEAFAADFEDLSQVRAAAAWVLERTDHLEVLANNAGGVFAERKITPDGHERTMQVNHYAGFLLTQLLMDSLLAARGVVVNTSSVGAHAFGRLRMDDLDASRKYRAMKAYGDSKLANILHVQGLHTRYHERGLAAVAIHPGNISSNFAQETGSALMRLIYKTPVSRLLSPAQFGADNLLWAMDSVAKEPGMSGHYFTEHRRPPRTPHPQEDDVRLVEALWAESARRVGVEG